MQVRISPEALAALAKAFPLYFIIISAGIGIVAGCNSLIANSLGLTIELQLNISYNFSVCLFSINIHNFNWIFFSYDILN